MGLPLEGKGICRSSEGMIVTVTAAEEDGFRKMG